MLTLALGFGCALAIGKVVIAVSSGARPTRAKRSFDRLQVLSAAGILGHVWHDAIGSFTYEKRHPNGPMPVRVTVYLLEVTGMLEDWPEKDERKRAWFTLADAARVVAEPELKALLNDLALSASTPRSSLDPPDCREHHRSNDLASIAPLVRSYCI